MDEVEIALRCHVAPPKKPVRGDPPEEESRTPFRPDLAFVLDVETTTDDSLRLLFGSAHLYTRERGAWRWTDEYLFYRDGLDRQSLQVLRKWRDSHTVKVFHRRFIRGTDVNHHFLPLSEFIKVFYAIAYEGKALVAGYNLKFDLSRIARKVAVSRSRRYAGGFALYLSVYKKGPRARQSRYRPPVLVKHVDRNRSFLGFGGCLGNTGDNRFSGNFLDVKTLVYALTGKSLSLEQACREFRVEHGKVKATEHGRITEEYIEYNRRDVQATAELLWRALEEFDRYPISPENPAQGKIPETRVYSTASIAKGILKALGVRPPLEKFHFPDELQGIIMSTYYGGRAEVNVRGIVPVVYVDYLSMYPTVFTLLGMQRFLIADQIATEDCTKEVQELLARDDLLQVMMRPQTWRNLATIVEILPEGDLLPVRGKFGEDEGVYNISEVYLSSERPLFYTLAHLIGSKIRTGKTPKVLRALRFTPRGVQNGLRPAQIYSGISMDLRHDDFARKLVEERQRAKKALPPYDRFPPEERERIQHALKILANSAFYGIFGEVNVLPPPARGRVRVRVFPDVGENFFADAPHSEQPGTFYFPLFATMITSAARLMLALLEKLVGDAGGLWAFCDTDSMAIISTEEGGEMEIPACGVDGKRFSQRIKALSWAEVQSIVDRFASLNPYDRSAVPGSIIKVEDENFCDKKQVQLYALVLNAKRYALFVRDAAGNPIIRKASHHGLGQLADPLGGGSEEEWSPEDEERETPSWIHQVWEYLVRSELGLTHQLPGWVDLPAVRVHAISTPHLYKPFAALNRGRSHIKQIRPFNFMLTVATYPWDKPRERFLLIAPYEKDPKRWRRLEWVDLYTGKRYRISSSRSRGRAIRVKTYRSYIQEFHKRPEWKRLGPDGRPCTGDVRGVLGYRSVRPSGVVYIGKEANNLEMRDLASDVEDVLVVYRPHRAAEDVFSSVILPALQLAPAQEIADWAGLSRRTIRRIKNQQGIPRRSTLHKLTRALAIYAGAQLRAQGADPPPSSIQTIRLWIDARCRTSSPLHEKEASAQDATVSDKALSKERGPRTRESAESCRAPTGKEEKKVDHDRPRAPYL
jgi:hypothetical protein